MLPAFAAQLPPEVQAALGAAARTARAVRGSLIFLPDDRAESVMAVHSGQVRLYRIGASAREITVAVHGPGDLIGAAAVVEGGHYGLYAEAMEDSELWTLGGEQLRALQAQHPALAVALSAQLTRQTQGVHERLTHLVFLEVSQRLALVLLDLARRQATPGETGGLRALRGRTSHQDLAHLVGSTRETITKLLGEFKERGLLDLGYRRIVVLDEAGLQRAAKEPIHTS